MKKENKNEVVNAVIVAVVAGMFLALMWLLSL
jgi:hypothetical protein